MIYQVGNKQCSISGQKQNDIAPLESDFMVQPPSLLEFPGPLIPPPPWNFQFSPWWGSGYFLELHIMANCLITLSHYNPTQWLEKNKTVNARIKFEEIVMVMIIHLVKLMG